MKVGLGVRALLTGGAYVVDHAAEGPAGCGTAPGNSVELYFARARQPAQHTGGSEPARFSALPASQTMPEDNQEIVPENRPIAMNEPLLFSAARVGDHDAIRRLVGAGEDVNVVARLPRDCWDPPRRATPLMVAAGSDAGASVETVRLLLELGADATRDLDGDTAATFAVNGAGGRDGEHGDALRLVEVLRVGARVPDHTKRWMLFRASVLGVDWLRAVIDAGIHPPPETDDDGSTMFLVARLGDAECLRRMLAIGFTPTARFDPAEAERTCRQRLEASRQEGVDPTFLEEFYKPALGPDARSIPLFGAAEGGSAECINLLIKAGADPMQVAAYGETPLFVAGSAEAVTALLRAGVPTDTIDRSGRDALDSVAERIGRSFRAPNEDTVAAADALIAAGVPLVRRKDEQDRLARAAFDPNVEGVRYLLSRGHPILTDERGQTPLFAACWHREWPERDQQERSEDSCIAIVRMLLDAGADPRARDIDGWTPMHEAMHGDGPHLAVVVALLEAGADVKVQDNEGRTPLHVLYDFEQDYLRAVRFLLQRGANPLIRDADGRTVVDAAESMVRGEEPPWRAAYHETLSEEEVDARGSWKGEAEPGDAEHEALELLRQAAARFATGQPPVS